MRRSNVSPCPVIAVLLITLGGPALEGYEATSPASCYYKEANVSKQCALFQRVACKDVGPHTYNLTTWGSHEGVADGRNYTNVTTELWVTEGYLRVKQLDECWQFQTGGRRHPEQLVTVFLYYFPVPIETDIVVSTDENHCAYLQNSLYTLQLFREDNGTLRARFTFRSVPEVETVNLILLGAECEVDCRVVDSACDVFDIHRIMANFSAPQVFSGLKQGYYCMRIGHGSCVVHTKNYTVEREAPVSQDIPNDDSLVLILTLSITGVVLVFILVIFLKRRSYGALRQLLNTEEQDAPTLWQSVHQQWASNPDPCKILLLYSRDCMELCDVVQALSQLLKSFGNVTVLDPMEQNQMEKVSENISGWLAQHLLNPDVKVVIVVSEGAKLRQRALLNNQIVHVLHPHFLDPVYTQAIHQMHEVPNLGSDYTRIFPVRFEDFTPSEESLSLIVPLKCYILQKHLGKLIVELRGFNTPTGPDLEDIRRVCPEEMNQLESTIKIMKLYCALNPHYIQKHFSLVVPSP